MPPWEASVTTATDGSHPVMCFLCFCHSTLHSSLQFSPASACKLHKLLDILLSFPLSPPRERLFLFPSVSFNKLIVRRSRISAHIPAVTCNTNCITSWSLSSIMPLPSSPQPSLWPQALTPHFMDHGPPARSVMCVLCFCVSDEEQRERSVTWSLDILTAFTLLCSTWRDVNGRWVSTPGALGHCVQTNTRILHSQTWTNASFLESPELRASLSGVFFRGLWSVDSHTLWRQIETLSLELFKNT